MWQLYTTYIVCKGYNTTDILPKCNNLSWSNDVDTLCTSLTFDSILDLAEGRSHIKLLKDNLTVFEGVVVNKTNKENIHSYTAMDFAFYLNKNKLIMQFNNISAVDALKQICSKVGIESNIINLTTNINKIYHSETLSDIIKDILVQCKTELGTEYIMEMQGKTLYINKLTDFKLTNKLLIGRDYSISRSMEDLQNRIIAVDNDGNVLADVKDQNSIDILGQLSDIVSLDDKNESQALHIASNTLKEKNKTKKEITFNIIDAKDGIYINCNRMIQVNLGKYGVDSDGWYRIKSTQHNLSNNMHKIGITIDFS